MVVRLSALHTGRFYPPSKCSWYSFLLEAESTPGTQCDRMDFMSMKKFQWHQLGSNQRPSDLKHSTLTTVLPRFPLLFCTGHKTHAVHHDAAFYSHYVLPSGCASLSKIFMPIFVGQWNQQTNKHSNLSNETKASRQALLKLPKH